MLRKCFHSLLSKFSSCILCSLIHLSAWNAQNYSSSGTRYPQVHNELIFYYETKYSPRLHVYLRHAKTYLQKHDSKACWQMIYHILTDNCKQGCSLLLLHSRLQQCTHFSWAPCFDRILFVLAIRKTYWVEVSVSSVKFISF